MEVSRDHPTPYPGKACSRMSVRSSIKGQENKLVTETNDMMAFSPKRQKHGLSVIKSVNTLDLPANDKPSRSSRRFSVSSKYATPVCKTEIKEKPLAVSDSNSTSSKPFLLPRSSALKSEKNLGVEANVRFSKKEKSVSFEDFSIRSQTKDNALNKDALLTSVKSIKSMVPVTSTHPSHWQKRKPNMLMSSSYWLDQIKLSESAGKHAISLGFFRLALESAAEPLQRLCDELKEYALKNNVLQFGEVAKDVLQSYGVLEEIMSADVNGEPVELEPSCEGSFSESRGFMTPIHEMSSLIIDDGEDGSTWETAKNIKGECQSTAEIVGLSTVSGFNVTNSFSEESDVSDLKMDKEVAKEDDNVEESVYNKSSRVLSEVMGSKTHALSKDYVMEGKAIGNVYAQQSISNKKSGAENGNLNVTDKTGSVAPTKISGSVLNKKNAIRKDTRSITMPAIMSQLYARESSKINSAEKAGAPKILRSTARSSCTLITNTKKESCTRKSTRQDEKIGTISNDVSPLDLPFSTDSGKEENRDNQSPQNMDQLYQCEDIKDFPSEYIEKLEGRVNKSTSEDTGFDILKMSVDTLMNEVVSRIMSSMDDCMDSPNPVQGSTVKSLEDNIRDTLEINSGERIMSPSTSSMADFNCPCGIVYDACIDIIDSGIARSDIAAGHDKKEMHEGLDGIPSKDDGKEIGANVFFSLEEEQEKCSENDANVTVQLGRAENDGIEEGRRVELKKPELHVTKSKFLGGKAVTGKGGLIKDLKNKAIGNSNKENIIGNSNKENIIDKHKVPSIQSGSIADLGKEVKVLDKFNGAHQNPGNGTPGSIRRSTRLRGHATS